LKIHIEHNNLYGALNYSSTCSLAPPSITAISKDLQRGWKEFGAREIREGELCGFVEKEEQVLSTKIIQSLIIFA
jgi:hypothetical protein